MKKRTFIFEHTLEGWGDHNRVKEEFEFDGEVTDEFIQEAYEDWVWEIVGDSFTWYEKEQDEEE